MGRSILSFPAKRVSLICSKSPVITYSKCPDHVLQGYKKYVHILKVWNFFWSHSGAIAESFRENCS